MAYDRYEDRDYRGRWRDDDRERGRYRGGGQDERGFFERAGDEVRSWFGDDEAERRREQDDRQGMYERGSYGSSSRFGERGGSFGGGQSSRYGPERERDYGSRYARGSGESGGFGRSDEDRYGRAPSSSWGRGRNEERGGFSRSGSSFGRDEGSYRPLAGDYGRGSEQAHRSGMGSQDFGRSQYGRQEFSQDQDRDRMGRASYAVGGWGDRESMRRDRGGSSRYSTDPHYDEWRHRQMSELDRDYDDYRREHQSKFENEFSGWRQQRQGKRQILQQLREDMEVVGSDGQRVGTVDKVRGDKVILNKRDPEAGGVHRSFSCSLLDRVEGDKVILSQPADQAKSQLRREEERSGGLFGSWGRDRDRDSDRMRDREDDRTDLNRSFSGTYER